MVPYDIQPETEIEVWVTAISMFIGLLLNAFAIGSMASALSSLDAKKSIAAEKLDTLGHYLQINAIGPDLRSRIFEFYEYLCALFMAQALACGGCGVKWGPVVRKHMGVA